MLRKIKKSSRKILMNNPINICLDKKCQNYVICVLLQLVVIISFITCCPSNSNCEDLTDIEVLRIMQQKTMLDIILPSTREAAQQTSTSRERISETTRLIQKSGLEI